MRPSPQVESTPAPPERATHVEKIPLFLKCRAPFAHRRDRRRDPRTGLWYCGACQTEPGAPTP